MTAAMPDTVVVTRPRHPLEGRELRVLGGMHRHGQLELLLVLPDGSKRSRWAATPSPRSTSPPRSGRRR